MHETCQEKPNIYHNLQNFQFAPKNYYRFIFLWLVEDHIPAGNNIQKEMPNICHNFQNFRSAPKNYYRFFFLHLSLSLNHVFVVDFMLKHLDLQSRNVRFGSVVDIGINTFWYINGVKN